MRRLSFAAAVLCGVALRADVAQAQTIVDRYAAALRYFNPALSADTSSALAERTIVEADRFALDARLLVALIATESAWRSEARSAAGASGLGQLMPATAAALGVDPADPLANVHGTARYLRSLLDRYRRFAPARRYELAVAGYNAGPGAVERFAGVPPFAETRAYVRDVLTLWRRLRGGA